MRSGYINTRLGVNQVYLLLYNINPLDSISNKNILDATGYFGNKIHYTEENFNIQ